MSFKDQSFKQRFQTMGDIAERAYEETTTVKFCRFGLNRPPINMSMLPLELRHTPDYLTSYGLVEVQGFGDDQTLEVNLDKLKALEWWNKVHPVSLFVYDSKHNRTCSLSMSDVKKLARKATVEMFPEGKRYYAIPAVLIWPDV